MKRFTKLANPSSWRRISLATWNGPNDPTVYGLLEFDFTKGAAFLAKLGETTPQKITVTHLVAKATALTLRDYPDLNGIIRWGQIYLRNSIDIFLQVAVPEGGGVEKPDLSGAKIDSCDRKDLATIAKELAAKSKKIRERKDPQFESLLKVLRWIPSLFLRPLVRLLAFFIHNLGGGFLGLPVDPFGSAMVTSVGSLGVPPGLAPLVPISRTPLIICVGEVVQKPWVVGELVVPRPILELGVTFDHRFMDGLTASRMLHYFREILENPERSLS